MRVSPMRLQDVAVKGNNTDDLRDAFDACSCTASALHFFSILLLLLLLIGTMWANQPVALTSVVGGACVTHRRVETSRWVVDRGGGGVW